MLYDMDAHGAWGRARYECPYVNNTSAAVRQLAGKPASLRYSNKPATPAPTTIATHPAKASRGTSTAAAPVPPDASIVLCSPFLPAALLTSDWYAPMAWIVPSATVPVGATGDTNELLQVFSTPSTSYTVTDIGGYVVVGGASMRCVCVAAGAGAVGGMTAPGVVVPLIVELG